MPKTKTKQNETNLVMPKAQAESILRGALIKCDAIVDKIACEELIRHTVNTILMSVSKVVGELSIENMNKEDRIHMVATITADIETMILPIIAKLLGKDIDKGSFEATTLARETKAIEENETIQVRHKLTERGQEIQTSVGVAIPKEIAELMDNFDENTIVGKS